MHSAVLVSVLILTTCLSSIAQSPDSPGKSTPPAVTLDAPVVIETPSPFGAAQKLFHDGQYPGAANAYRALMTEKPNAAVAAGLGRSLLRMEDLKSASEVIKKGLNDYPQAPAIHEAYGELLFRNGSLWDAEVEFVKTINTWGPNAQAYLWLSRVYTASAYHKKSRKMIEQAYKFDPDDPEVASAYHRATQPSKQLILRVEGEDAKDDSAGELLQQITAHKKRGCSVVGAPRDIQVPLARLLSDPQHLHGFGLDMFFNKQHGRLLLDTGAGGILINRRLAEKAGAKRVAASTILGIGDKGGAASYLAHIDSVKIGDLELRDCTVEVSEKRNVLDDDGLIGTDLFKDFLVRLDFAHEKFKLSALPPYPDEEKKQEEKKGDGEKDAQKHEEAELHDPYRGPEIKDFSKMYRVGHYLLIPTRVNDLPPKLFLLDTGAFNNMISPEAAREVTKVRGEEEFIVKGLNGKVNNLYTADQATLQFSHYKQKNQDLTAFDLSGFSRSAGMEISGALGFAMLRLLEISIDYRDGLIDFNYDSKQFPGLR